MISFGLALLYSYRIRDALQCPPLLTRLICAVAVGHLVLVIAAWQATQGLISPGMIIGASCLSGWVFSIGLLQWHRPTVDTEVF